MNQREKFLLKVKRIKPIEEEAKKRRMDGDIKMDIEASDDKKKSNFSSHGNLSTSNNGVIGRGNSSSNTKGDIKKLIIKNFKSTSIYFFTTHVSYMQI